MKGSQDKTIKRVLDTVRNTIREKKLLSGGEQVWVAVSGGPDSVALLDILHSLRDELGIFIRVMHINHHTRGAESDADERFTRTRAAMYGYQTAIRDIKMEQFSEEKARSEREEIFSQIIKDFGGVVATGHTADDTVETFLFNLLRGTGIDGLSGIPPKRDFYIRPLIDLFREDILAYLHSRELTFRTDHTNLLPTFFRNKIRLELIPYLEKFNPHTREHIYTAVSLIQEQKQFLKGVGREIIAQNILFSSGQFLLFEGKMLSLGKLFFGETLKFVFEHFGIGLQGFTSAFVRSIWGNISAGNNLLVLTKKGAYALTLEVKKELALFSFLPTCFQMEEPVSHIPNSVPIPYNLGSILFKPAKRGAVKSSDDECTVFLSLPPDAKLTVRTPKKGETFLPLGLGGYKKVSSYLKVRFDFSSLRRYVPAVFFNDKLAWVPGGGISELFKITDSTENILRLEIRGPLADLIRSIHSPK